MGLIDMCVAAMGVVGLVVWIRGWWKGSVASCALGLVAATLGCVLYFGYFHFTRTAYLPAIVLTPLLLTMVPLRHARGTGGGAMAALVAALICGAAVLEQKLSSSGNALLVIEPYRTGTTWRFDEPRFGLRGEPFVAGASEMIDKLVADIPDAHKGVRLIFSQGPFPGATHRLDRRRSEYGGTWYYSEEHGMECWLCPALFKFFPRAPRYIYVKAEPK